MTYTPNFADARVQRRIRRAIGFACGAISSTKPQEWSTRYIDRWFGSQRNQLSKYLRDQLLIVTDHTYYWGDSYRCKKYLQNSVGVTYLSERLNLHQIGNTYNHESIAVEEAKAEFVAELDSGTFIYNDQSSRLWHPLQNWRRDAKMQILQSAGYHYHYDIQCCALTLIHQHSQKIAEIIVDNKWKQGPMDLYLFALRDYLRDRKQIRAQIAQQAEISQDVVKRIINALLAGAKLSTNKDSDIYQLLDGDIAKIRFLQQHEFISKFKEDIRVVWEYIKPTLSRRSKTQASGKQRMLPISSRQKWGVYFDLERQVLNQVRDFLSQQNIRHFLEHDGWSCECEIDQSELQLKIFENTGFQVEFEHKRSL